MSTITPQQEADFILKYGLKPDDYHAKEAVQAERKREHELELAKLGIGDGVLIKSQLDTTRAEAEAHASENKIKELELRTQMPFLKTLPMEVFLGLARVCGTAVLIHAIWAIVAMFITWVLVVKGWRG